MNERAIRQMKPAALKIVAALISGLLAITACRLAAPSTDLPSSPTPPFTPAGQPAAAPVRVFFPLPNQVIDSPLVIEGEARGIWFFEATFPIRLYDASGNLLASAVAQAQGEWMTEEFVPFRANLEFVDPTADSGTLVLERSNPSGMEENAGEIRIPVRFEGG